MKGPLMYLIYFTLIIVGLALVLVWLMYSASVHGHFRFRWDAWENWVMIVVILFCFGLPVRNLVLIKRNKQLRK
jgi:TRAP-type uncharacterized transport system fused permease subunit